MKENRLHDVLPIRFALLFITGLLAAACAQMPVPLPSVDTAQPSASEPTVVVPSGAETVVALVTALPTLVADWKVFDNSGAGYSISYPQDVHITTGESKAGIHTARIQFRIPGVDGYQGMLIRVEPNPDGAGVEQVVGALYERIVGSEASADIISGLEGVAVDGVPGVRMGEGEDFAIVVPYADRVYIIAPVHGLATTALDPRALALFYQVLSTLKVQR